MANTSNLTFEDDSNRLPVSLLRWSLIQLLVFFTGASGLVYQVVWQRYLARLLGNDSVSIAIILAVFLGGLSVGYWMCGRWTRRLRNCFRGYAALELAIGLWAGVFPFLFDALQSATVSWSFAPTPVLLGQGVLCAIALIGFPAVCMGGTVPLLTRGLTLDLEGATRIHARIYGINTAGAFLGALLAGFWMIPAMGLPTTLRCAAAVNGIAAVFFALLPKLEVPTSAPNLPDPTGTPPPQRAVLLVVGFLSGAYVMMLENVLVRVVSLSFGSSSYSFSLVVAVFVLCLALGSLWVGGRKAIRHDELFLNQAAVTIAWLGLFVLLDKAPYFAHLVRICFQPNVAGFWVYQVAILGALLLILGLPVAWAGATLPLLFHRLKQAPTTVGSDAGALLAFNAAGCVGGSLGGGLLLYSFLDNGGIFLTAVGLAAVSAVLAAGQLGRARQLASLALLIVTLTFGVFRPGFDPHRFAFGTFRLQSPVAYSFSGPGTFYEEFGRSRRLHHYRDGASGTVAVTETVPTFQPPPGFAPPLPMLSLAPALPADAAGGTATNALPLAIIVNGKSDSEVFIDRETLRLTAHLPALWARKRTQVMIVGLGTGVTAGEIGLYPDVERIDVAELSSGVADALPLFGASTGNIHQDPRFHLQLGDAFRVIGRSSKRWDILISEPSNPWVTGVDQLFSTDYYRLVRDHLTEDGVFVQWVQQYSFNTEAFLMVIASVKSAFPHFTLFHGRQGDLILMAANHPFMKEQRQRAENTLRGNPRVIRSLADLGINSWRDVIRRERPILADVVRQLSTGHRVETLDRPRLHYLAGRTFFNGEEFGRESFSPFQGGPVISEKVFEEPVVDP